MNTNKLAVVSSTIACALVMRTSLSAQAAEALVRWDRIAGVLSGAPPISERWLAYGAVRSFRTLRLRADDE